MSSGRGGELLAGSVLEVTGLGPGSLDEVNENLRRKAVGSTSRRNTT
jgi:hypothetical protein